MPASAHRGFVLLLTAGLLWGTGGISGHLLQADAGLAPLSVAAYRLLLGGGLITVLLVATGRLRGRPPVRALLVNGVLHAVFQGLYFGSLALVPVGFATLVKIGSVPVFVTAGLCLAARRAPAPRLAAAVLIAVAGLVLLTGFPGPDGGGWRLAGGVACALGAGLVFSVMTLLNRGPGAGIDPLVNIGVGGLIGGVLLLPAGLWAGMAVPADAESIGLLAFLALVPTAIAYVAYFAGLRTASDSAVAMATVTEPLTAAVLSMVLLGEEMTVLGMLGGVLLLVAMAADYLLPGRRRAT
ncbi:DMT family transporter [Murinocardiopsis flavida]|uniref:DMT family transporter n=1 Tax=Murinocardiopsis flavida TaxID=645275 RepID=UPI000D0CA359|nr:DMT family transporter [Murinocardiopsis flavida]